MGLSIQGKLYKKFETKAISATFRKREFVMEFADNPMYPQFVTFQLIQDKADLLEPFQEGQMLSVEFDLRGREWTSPQGEVKYFNSLDAWRIAPVQEQMPTQGQPPVGTMPPPPLPPEGAIDGSSLQDDDLPF
ncbi:MAG: DUF3127 domain-containing protein [Bacteroidia bacterium]|nr:DUF3127 domain-containing protein [Bacteroidia bacterium]